MTLAAFKSMICMPERPTAPSTGGGTYSSLLLDAVGESAAAIFKIPKTGNIHAIGWRTSTVTTGGQLNVRLETVSAADGNPTGTLWGTNTYSGPITLLAAEDNTWFTSVLVADAAVTIGDIVAVVMVNVSGDMTIANTTENTAEFPYIDHYTTAWAKQNNAPVVALQYDDGTYEPIFGCYPYKALNAPTFNSGSTPDERGLKFQLPFPFRVHGFWLFGDIEGDTTIKLYDSDGSTVLASVSLDKDIRRSGNFGVQYMPLTSTVDLSANTYYRLTALPGATTIGLSDFDVSAVAVMDAMTGGQYFHYTERTDAGAWTDTTTKRPFMGVMVSALDSGGGSGPVVVAVAQPVFIGSPCQVSCY